MEKWRLYDGDMVVVVKSELYSAVQATYSLMDESMWDIVYYVNGQSKRMCRHIMDEKTMCIEFTFEPETNQIERIQRISVIKTV